jgi:hypothetical protein
MPKVTYEHLEQVRKALLSSKKTLEQNPVTAESAKKAAELNRKAIEMLDDEYLDIKP